MVDAPIVREHLEMIVRMHRSSRVSPQRVLLDHGLAFAPRVDLPKGVRRGPPQQCYANAYRLARRRPDVYTYVEGMAFRLIPVEHAWCVDREGRMVDPTWRPLGASFDGADDRREYFGIPLRLDYVRRVRADSRLHTVLWNWRADWPLTRDDPRLWKAKREDLTPGGVLIDEGGANGETR